jgi:hypothetical protein
LNPKLKPIKGNGDICPLATKSIRLLFCYNNNTSRLISNSCYQIFNQGHGTLIGGGGGGGG